MTKKFEELFPSVSSMTDEQLQGHIGDIRRRKYIERKAKIKHDADDAAPAQRKTNSKVAKLVGQMTDEEKAALIAQLEALGDS